MIKPKIQHEFAIEEKCDCGGKQEIVCFEDNVWVEKCVECGRINPMKFMWRFV